MLLPFSTAAIAAFVNFSPVSPSAQRGLQHLYAGNILAVKGGVPVSLIRRADALLGTRQLEKLQDPAHQFGRYGYEPSPPERNAGGIEVNRLLPLSLSGFLFADDRGTKVRQAVTNTCLACHVSFLDGQVIGGVGNNFAYFPAFREDMTKLKQMRTMLNVNPIWYYGTSAREKAFLNTAISYFDLVLDPMLKKQRTRGAITGPASVLTYLTRMTTNRKAKGLSDSLRTDTKKLIQYDLEQAPDIAPPVKAHPWWTIKYKPTLYRYPEEKGATAEITAQNFMDRHIGVSDRLAPLHRPLVQDVLQFAAEMKAPPYRRSLNMALAAEGERLFHERPLPRAASKTCAGCHGTYHWQGQNLEVNYPSRFVDAGTDPAVFQTGRYFMDAVKRRVPADELAAFGEYPQKLGYLAPPLVGVWASAPYLHNGSVPTLYSVLKASSRPRVWARSPDPAAYDEKNGGLTLAVGSDADRPGQRYDTTLSGYGNQGHAFAEGWDDSAIYAVVEFLKTLND